MSEHTAIIEWTRNGQDHLAGKYSREHRWSFDGGASVLASSAPANVPVPLSNPAGVDPEEALVAAISSCHMLTFLRIAAQRGFQIDDYRDNAVGEMTLNARGKKWVSRVELRPTVAYSGDKRPTKADQEAMHHTAHEECFIANSVKTEIVVTI